MSIAYWLRRVAIPVVICSGIAVASALLPRLCMPESFMRLVAVIFISEFVLLPLSWLLVLDGEERNYTLTVLRKTLRI